MFFIVLLSYFYFADNKRICRWVNQMTDCGQCNEGSKWSNRYRHPSGVSMSRARPPSPRGLDTFPTLPYMDLKYLPALVVHSCNDVHLSVHVELLHNAWHIAGTCACERNGQRNRWIIYRISLWIEQKVPYIKDSDVWYVGKARKALDLELSQAMVDSCAF